MEIGFFFENAEVDQSGFKPSTQQRLLLELARSFIALPSRKHQEAICNLARVLAYSDPINDTSLTIPTDD